MRRIFAMGGGGFTMEPRNPALDDFILSLCPKPEPRVLFLPTASGDPTAQIQAFRERFGNRRCRPQELSLFRRHGSRHSLEEIVLDQDVVYVGGGSMRNLLAIWRAHELDRMLADACRRGVLLAGLSAGAMCWFEGGITKSSGPPEPIAGLGLLKGSFTVHADGEPERLPAFVEAVRNGELLGGWAADDGVGLLFEDGRHVRTVSSRPGATAHRYDLLDGEMLRIRIEPELLEVSHPAIDEDVLEFRRVQGMRDGF